jgi:cytochrome c oxidase subunit II
VQKFWSILFGVVLLGAFLMWAVSPYVGWWLPKNVATFGGGVDYLYFLILGITGFFFVLTEAILVYALWRFSGAPGRKAPYVHGHHTLEVVWTLVPGVILLLLAIVQINVWAEIKFQKNMPKPDGRTQQMEVTARQWEWRVRYPNRGRMESWEKNPKLAQDFSPHVDDIQLANEVHVWKGGNDKETQHNVLVHLRTLDVIHSFFLPHLRLKQDALPGKIIPVWFAVTEHNTEKDPKSGRWIEIGYDPATGTSDPSIDTIWELACAEYCGTRHSLMRGRLFVHKDKADFLEWLKWAEEQQNQHRPAPAAEIVAR